MPDGNLWMIVGIIVCVAFSAFFSSSETAFTSMNKNKMKNLAQNGNKTAALALKMSENYAKLLSTILVGNNIVNTALPVLATLFLANVLANTGLNPSVMSTVITTVVVLIFGEITPKAIAKDHPEGFALAVTPLLRFIQIILTPVNIIFMGWKKLINLIFKPGEENVVTEGEVLTLIDEAHEGGSIDEYNKELIENIFEFDDLTAGEIATHRIDVTALDIESTVEEWNEIINNNRYSRYPVYGNGIDDIIGILDARNYFRIEEKNRENILRDAVTPAYFVPDTVKADLLFKNMKARKEKLAIVLDEYGGVHGLVTFTDLVECLVGEFDTPEDEETSEPEELIEKLEDDTWKINGGVSLEEVEEKLGVKLENEDSDTFGGYVLGLYGSVPEDGSTFDVSTDKLDIKIESIQEHKIEKAIVSIRSEEEAEEEKSKEKEENNDKE